MRTMLLHASRNRNCQLSYPNYKLTSLLLSCIDYSCNEFYRQYRSYVVLYFKQTNEIGKHRTGLLTHLKVAYELKQAKIII
jgi:hypothetical protein